jgi:hypothetical protein
MLYINGLGAVTLMHYYSSATLMTQTATPPPPVTKIKRLKSAISNGTLISGSGRALVRDAKRKLKPLLVSAGKAALRRPWVKRSVLAVLNRSPKLKNRLYRLVWKDIALAPRAMRIYTALSTTIPTHRTTHTAKAMSDAYCY